MLPNKLISSNSLIFLPYVRITVYSLSIKIRKNTITDTVDVIGGHIRVCQFRRFSSNLQIVKKNLEGKPLMSKLSEHVSWQVIRVMSPKFTIIGLCLVFESASSIITTFPCLRNSQNCSSNMTMLWKLLVNTSLFSYLSYLFI